MALIISIIVGLFILFFAIKGAVQGFFKIALSTFSLLLTIILASVLMTPLTNFLVEKTEIRNSLEHKIEKSLGWSEEGAVSGNDSTGTDDWEKILSSAGIDEIKALLKKLGVSNSDEVIEEITKNKEEDAVTAAENEIIEGMTIPGILKNSLKNNNKPQKYIEMGVANFKGYIVRSITDLIIKILVFITLIIVIYILIRLILVLSKIITSLPVIHGINKFFGFLLGIMEGLLFVWLACFIITLISGTAFGIQVVAVIHESKFLTYIYDNNWLLAGINKLFSMF